MNLATTYKTKARGKKGLTYDHYPISTQEMLRMANSLPTLGLEFMVFLARAKSKIVEP